MRMHRRAALAAIALLSAISLAACGGSSPTDSTAGASDGAASGISGEVTVLAAASLKEAFPEIADKVKEENPDLTITFDFKGSQDLVTALAEGQAAIEEERRLLYVGVTRAREHLIISYARARNAGGRAARKPSRFLDGLWPTAQGSRDGSRRQGRLSAKERSRQSAADFEASNDPRTIALFEELRAWRSGVAKERSKPAYTVFADATLRDIAVVKPTTLPQLSLIRGVGATKLQEYGGSVLALLRDFESGS